MKTGKDHRPSAELLTGHAELWPEVEPAGLASPMVAENWTFLGGESIAWTRLMRNDVRLCDAGNEHFFELARRYFSALRNNLARPEGLGTSTIIGKVRVVLLLSDFAISLGLTRISDMSYVQWEHLRDNLSRGFKDLGGVTVSVGRIRIILEVCDDLYRLYGYRRDGKGVINDGFAFAPFPNLTEASRFAVRHGKETSAVEDPPEIVVFAYIDAAVEYVMLHSDYLIDLKRKEEQQRAAPRPVKRARNWQRLVAVADALQRELDENVRPFNSPVDMVTIRKSVAKAAGIHTAKLSRARNRRLVTLFEVAARRGDRSEFDLETALLRRQFAKGSRKQVRYVAGSGGLFPSSGYENSRYLVFPIVGRRVRSGRGSGLQRALNNLWSSCFLLILAFMADRFNEGLKLKIDCLVERPDGLFLRSPIFKTSSGEMPTYTEHPCPPIVGHAVKVMLRLFEEERAEQGSDYLFYHTANGKVPAQQTVSDRLKVFGESTGASMAGGGEPYFIFPMQLRRFFVTTWINYYEHSPNFDSLRKFIGHKWIWTLQAYYSHQMLTGEFAAKTAKALTFRVMNRILFEGIDTKGPFSKRVRRLIGGITIRAVTEEKIHAVAEAWIKTYDAIVWPMPWGYCFWSIVAGSQAQCVTKSKRRHGMSRPIGEKDCKDCAGCNNFAMLKNFEGWWTDAEDRHSRILKSPHAPNMLKVAAAHALTFIRRLMGSARA